MRASVLFIAFIVAVVSILAFDQFLSPRWSAIAAAAVVILVLASIGGVKK